MFELSVALKYLIPRRKQLSVSLIALLSVVVISLVVWLVLVFLSVTEGIERGWLSKLTTLNAPLRITPTPQYFDSYFYQIDSVSGQSQYAYKNIGEKIQTVSSNPYQLHEDGELPMRFPQPDLNENGSLKDPVKELLACLENVKQSHRDLVYQDFEISGALMRLQLLRPGVGIRSEETQGFLTQVSYLASFPDRCPELASLLLSPSEKDLNHLLFLASHSTELSRQDAPALTAKTTPDTTQSRIAELLKQVHIQQLKPRNLYWQLSPALLPEHQTLIGTAQFRGGHLSRIDIPVDAAKAKEQIKIWKEGDSLFFQDSKGQTQSLPPATPLLVNGPLVLNVMDVVKDTPIFQIRAALQGVTLSGKVNLEGLEIARADFLNKQSTMLWVPANAEKETGVLLAKSYLANGVLIGDRGYLSYSSSTSSSVQEHRLPIFVAGFYDPGLFSVGNKCILVPPSVTRTINASSSAFHLDKTQSNGLLVWFKDLEQTDAIKQELVAALAAQGLSAYWQVTTFRDYDFAKDLLQQFQSDKTLFALVGVIILIVACCNIISLLVLLVNDKKREIGILQAMGASRFSIAAIFGCCGVGLGILSSLIGTIGALITLHHIDVIAQVLSFFQGHDAFNAVFFGKSLPDQLSHNAVLFISIATPFLSLLAGLVPAIKACRLRPSAILRSE